jgi:two-component system response regulator FixJ
MKRWLPDLIFSDVVMPETSGFQFVDDLRAGRVMCPVVLLTAHGTVDMARRARAHQGVLLLMKPLDYGALRNAVEEMLRPSTGRSA